MAKRFLFASDFDQTLSFNDSGHILSEILGLDGFTEKCQGLANINLVQQGAELAYLLRHDPAFRGVRKEDLIDVGKRVRLKKNVDLLANVLHSGINGYQFDFYVITAAPIEVAQSALEGIIPPDHIFGTEFDFDAETGEICVVKRVPAGYGKVSVLEELGPRLQITPDRTVYIGDGSSDMTVMHHVNSRDGYTIAVSDVKNVGRIAKRTVLSDNALGVLVPFLEDVLHYSSAEIRNLFSSFGLALQDWDKIHTDWLTIHEEPAQDSEKAQNPSQSENILRIA